MSEKQFTREEQIQYVGEQLAALTADAMTYYGKKPRDHSRVIAQEWVSLLTHWLQVTGYKEGNQ